MDKVSKVSIIFFYLDDIQLFSPGYHMLKLMPIELVRLFSPMFSPMSDKSQCVMDYFSPAYTFSE